MKVIRTGPILLHNAVINRAVLCFLITFHFATEGFSFLQGFLGCLFVVLNPLAHIGKPLNNNPQFDKLAEQVRRSPHPHLAQDPSMTNETVHCHCLLSQR